MKHALLLVLVGCVPEAPASPSFQEDVLPILAANCVRCHGYPTIGGAPPAFRLDAFADTVVSDGEPSTGCGAPTTPEVELEICGAATYASLIAARVDGSSRPMPPRFPLEDVQITTLENWARDPVRGAPRLANHVPSVVVEAVSRVDDLLTVTVSVDDTDRDLVVGTLFATVAGRARVVGTMRSGRDELVWNIAGIPSGDYPLVAKLDDGADLHEVTLGTLTIEER